MKSVLSVRFNAPKYIGSPMGPTCTIARFGPESADSRNPGQNKGRRHQRHRAACSKEQNSGLLVVIICTLQSALHINL